MDPLRKEEVLTELEDITRWDFFARFPEERSIWFRMEGVRGWGARLDSSLAFASTLPLPVLRMLVEELRRGDSTASGPAELFMRLCPAPGSGPVPLSPLQIEADLIDQIIFRDIRVAHRTVIHDRAKAAVKGVLGVARDQSLAMQTSASFGLERVFALVDIATSLGAVQLHHQFQLRPPNLGYSYLDDLDVAMDSCVSMTVPLAHRVLDAIPSVDQLVTMVHDGSLAEWGIIPADLNEDEVRQHLSRLHATYSARELPADLPPGGH